jgi:hypothetical protein
MVSSGHGEPAHVGVDLDGLHQAVDGLCGVRLLEAVGAVHEVGSRVVLAARFAVQVGRLAERLSSLIPLLGHFEHVARPLIAFHCLFHLG